jgi:glucose-6-phosphate isomerase
MTPEISCELASFQSSADEIWARLAAKRVVPRIWQRDHRVWRPDPKEISNRLDWLDVADTMADELPRFVELAETVRTAGYERILLLGMGGSSLAPEMFRLIFGVKPGYPELSIVDTTDPAALQALAGSLDPARTLWLVASKSGGTVETLSQLKFFYGLACEALGPEEAGEHFVAITDRGSKLAALAEKHAFRATIWGVSDIGGRFSALSPFGLVPAALIGMDLERLLTSARAMADRCGPEAEVRDNPAALLGGALAALASEGRDKLTLVLPEACTSFGGWVEQLVAESTGKLGKGILPVVGEPLGAPEVYGSDRVFVQLRLAGDPPSTKALGALVEAGHPVIRLDITDLDDLGGQLFLWEMATAVIGSVLGINPFDQPDVEAAKIAAREVVEAFHEKGALPPERPAVVGAGLALFGEQVEGDSLDGALAAFLEGIEPPGYLAIQAFLQPTEATSRALAELQLALRDRLRVAVTVGYGPRFLHSTGQLHKGDAGKGRFLQLTADDPLDLPIPDEMGSKASALSFGVLKAAQARGDRQALTGTGRQAICLHLGTDVAAGLEKLKGTIG